MGKPNGRSLNQHHCGAIGRYQEKPNQLSTPLIALMRLLARQAAREALADITAGQSTNQLPKFESESGDG